MTYDEVEIPHFVTNDSTSYTADPSDVNAVTNQTEL